MSCRQPMLYPVRLGRSWFKCICDNTKTCRSRFNSFGERGLSSQSEDNKPQLIFFFLLPFRHNVSDFNVCRGPYCRLYCDQGSCSCKHQPFLRFFSMSNAVRCLGRSGQMQLQASPPLRPGQKHKVLSFRMRPWKCEQATKTRVCREQVPPLHPPITMVW